MRIVLDTNILVRANIKARGPARDLLLKIAYGNHVIITSPFLLREVERALTYPRLQKLWRLSLQDIQEHVQFLVGISELVHPVIGAPVVLTDPNDDPRGLYRHLRQGGRALHVRSGFLRAGGRRVLS